MAAGRQLEKRSVEPTPLVISAGTVIEECPSPCVSFRTRIGLNFFGAFAHIESLAGFFKKRARRMILLPSFAWRKILWALNQGCITLIVEVNRFNIVINIFHFRCARIIF